MQTDNFTWFLVGKGEEDENNYRSSMVAAMEFLKVRCEIAFFGAKIQVRLFFKYLNFGAKIQTQ